MVGWGWMGCSACYLYVGLRRGGEMVRRWIAEVKGSLGFEVVLLRGDEGRSEMFGKG